MSYRKDGVIIARPTTSRPSNIDTKDHASFDMDPVVRIDKRRSMLPDTKGPSIGDSYIELHNLTSRFNAIDAIRANELLFKQNLYPFNKCGTANGVALEEFNNHSIAEQTDLANNGLDFIKKNHFCKYSLTYEDSVYKSQY